MQCLVLDAMGVIFAAADDVADLLIPFVREAGGSASSKEIESAYLEASLGVIDADEFWSKVGLDTSLENVYLLKHSLMSGVGEFLLKAKRSGIPVWCLSNDVDRWSRKLRATFNIEDLLAGAVISSEAKARKPDRRIYECLLDRSGYRVDELLFIDDRAKNVEAASALGIRSLRFSSKFGYEHLADEIQMSTL